MLYRQENALARYTRDLTTAARAGRLEPVRCRADEIARLMDILLRQGKNNPVLVGPAGVGKTAIAEGLAQRIAAGDAPLRLRDSRVLALDHVALLAGTTYRGDYEERMRAIIAEVSAASDAILFVDELHNLIGQGTAMGAAMDAANMLKPALVRGDFRVIGATTDAEYERWVRGDPALERRFQKIEVRELGAEETLQILRARQEGLERHHGVVITDEAMVAALRLTDLFVTDRMRPDRALDALDEACAHAHALATYSRGAEALLQRRKVLASGQQAREAREPGETSARREQGGSEAGTSALGGDVDPLDRFAREGFAALERLGLELESAFTGTVDPPEGGASRNEQPRGGGTAPPDAAAGAAAPAGRSAKQGPARSLAEVEAELRQLLIEEGVVVRGHEVARVVSVATGRSVRWES